MSNAAPLCRFRLAAALPLLWIPFTACAPSAEPPPAEPDGMTEAAESLAGDPHSYARPEERRVEHLALDLDVDFEAKSLAGRASWRLAPGDGEVLVLDTDGLDISTVTLDDGETAAFELGEEDDLLGQALTIEIAPGTEWVHIDYASRPEAAALQWLGPEQTAGGEESFLLSQSQAILARTWVPCQDTPGVRFTYEAELRAPPGLLALMSAENPTEISADGRYSFSMPQAIPSYLMAIAVGKLEFRAIGERSGVYAEPPLVEAAAWEFGDLPAMIEATEELYGPYRWGRYDLLVLPPSFPFGGMENPRLTFLTPTILAGDRSLVALVAHELAHSWSGNLVTNATWDDFWLNEGFTTYLTYRIMESVYGEPYERMLAALGIQDLRYDFEELDESDTHLKLALAGRNPDDGMTDVAYEKGALFLRALEETYGREAFDPFLRSWFDGGAFESRTTEDFIAYAEEHLIGPSDEPFDLEAWIYGPGLPAGHPEPTSPAFEAVESVSENWAAGESTADDLPVDDWTTQEWLHFLRGLPESIDADDLAELDAAFDLTESGNVEILAEWLTQAERRSYPPARPALEAFLLRVGRTKFLRPLYRELAQTEDGLAFGRELYSRARPRYHALSRQAIDEILEVDGEAEG